MENTSTDWRALCAELVAGIDNYDFDLSSTQQDYSVLERARAALAQPEPVGLTDEEILNLSEEHEVSYTTPGGCVINPYQDVVDIRYYVLSFARALITADRARCGRPAVEPEANGTA